MMKSCKKGYYYCNTEQKCKPIPDGYTVKDDGFLVKEDKQIKKIIKQLRKSVKSHDKQADTLEKKLNEEGLRAWFGKSSGTTKSGRKVKGWVQVGGKYDGKPCARQPGQKTTPKCTSSSKRRSMSDKERDSAARRKRAADPNQPQKSGAAAPTMVSTDPKRKMKEEFTTLPLRLEIPKSTLDFKQGLMFRESLDTDSGMLFVFDNIAQQSFHMTETRIPLDIAFIREDGVIESIKQLEPNNPVPVYSEGAIETAIEVNRGWFAENNVEVGDQLEIEYVIPNQRQKYRSETGTIFDIINEVKDKKGKGSGSKDACYHKVKSRYSVWPSAYASGALVKCRKVGAANWGNKSEAYEVTNADKKGNTPAYQGFKAGKKNKLTGKPLYKAAPHMKENAVEIQNSDGQTIAGVVDIVGPANMKPITSEDGVWKGTEQISEMKRDEYGDPVGGPKISKKQKAKNLASNTPDEQHTTTTSEGSAYGMFKGSGKPSGQMAAFGKQEKKPNPYGKRAKLKMLIKGFAEKERMKAGVTKEEAENIDEKCWKGYEKKGMKTMFGKRYPNCVKKKVGESVSNWRDEIGYEGKDEVKKLSEDDMKGMSVSSGHKRPTKSGAGMTQKGVEAYRRKNPGSKLKTAVTTEPSKLKKGSKASNRRKSYCARSAGQMKKFPKAAKDPNSRLRQARRRWNC